MKIASGILAALFALFAAWQWNDPDGWLWMATYGLVAAMGVLTVLGRAPRWLLLSLLTALLVAGVWQLPHVMEWLGSDRSLITGMSAEYMYVEQSRECLGLLLAAAATGFFLYQTARAVPQP